MIGLTPRQAELLRYLKAHPDASIREMKLALGWRSTSATLDARDALAECGYIRFLPNRARSIEVLDRSPITIPLVINGQPQRAMFLTPEMARRMA